MTELSQKILSDYQVRKSKKQKLAFIELLRQHYPDLIVEEGGFGHNRNIIVGDVNRAKVLLSAHYDTCARLPFPNLITPKNFLITLLYNLLIVIPFLAVFFLSFALIGSIACAILEGPIGILIAYFGSLFIFIGLYLWVFMLGTPNKHTANDNTSGVITLCELMATLSDEERAHTAFVFFDNEENGLLGSSFFKSKHRKELATKLLINFDCVSDGDQCLIIPSKSATFMCGNSISEAFTDRDNKSVHIGNPITTFYPSDQMGFPNYIAVAFLKKNRIFGLYMNKIHTDKDRVFDQTNIEYICTGMKCLVGRFITK